MLKHIIVAKEFSDDPAGRYYDDGPNSGQRFREECLVPLLKSGASLVILLDGANGYPSSFLEEAFGGLVRDYNYTPKELRTRIEVKANGLEYQRYIDAIWRYIDRAEAEKR